MGGSDILVHTPAILLSPVPGKTCPPCSRHASWWLGHVCSHTRHVVVLQHVGLGVPSNMPSWSHGCKRERFAGLFTYSLCLSTASCGLGTPVYMSTLSVPPHGRMGMSAHVSAMSLCCHLATWANLFTFLSCSSSTLGRIARFVPSHSGMAMLICRSQCGSLDTAVHTCTGHQRKPLVTLGHLFIHMWYINVGLWEHLFSYLRYLVLP